MTVRNAETFVIVPGWLLDLTAAGSEAPPKALAVYCAVARHADNTTGEATPSRGTIGRLADCSVDTVDRVSRWLIGVGALSRTERPNERDDGGQTSNLWTVHRAAPGSRTSAAPPPHPRGPGSRTSAAPPAAPARPKLDSLELDGLELEPPLTPPQAEGAPALVLVPDVREDRTRELDEAFALWWQTYPRKVGRKAAERAYRRAAASLGCGRDARTKTVAEVAAVLLAGAERYRDDPNREAAYTAHPSTWLNQGRWDDDPLPERAGAVSALEAGLAAFRKEQQR